MKAIVALGNDEYPVEIDARDRRAFERLARKDLGDAIPRGTLKDVINALPETYIAWLAYHALCTREQVIKMLWPDFERMLLEVRTEEGDSDDGLDPTLPTPTGG